MEKVQKGIYSLVRAGNRSVSSLMYHAVFVTKYRKKTLPEEDIVMFVLDKVAKRIRVDIKKMGIGGDGDHLHLLFQADPKLSPSYIVAVLKAQFSRDMFMRKEKGNWGGWSRGFYIASVGTTDMKAIERYIENQEEKDRTEESVTQEEK